MHALHEHLSQTLAEKLAKVWYDERGEFKEFVAELAGDTLPGECRIVAEDGVPPAAADHWLTGEPPARRFSLQMFPRINEAVVQRIVVSGLVEQWRLAQGHCHRRVWLWIRKCCRTDTALHRRSPSDGPESARSPRPGWSCSPGRPRQAKGPFVGVEHDVVGVIADGVSPWLEAQFDQPGDGHRIIYFLVTLPQFRPQAVLSPGSVKARLVVIFLERSTARTREREGEMPAVQEAPSMGSRDCENAASPCHSP